MQEQGHRKTLAQQQAQQAQQTSRHSRRGRHSRHQQAQQTKQTQKAQQTRQDAPAHQAKQEQQAKQAQQARQKQQVQLWGCSVKENNIRAVWTRGSDRKFTCKRYCVKHKTSYYMMEVATALTPPM